MSSKLILIPARNEAATLATLVAEARECRQDFDILIIDDASNDATQDLLPRLGVEWIRLDRRSGVGDAVRRGLAFARDNGYETVVRLDADGQHLPGDIVHLETARDLNNADAVVGSRYRTATGYRTPILRRLVQRTLSAALSARLADRITDPTSGFWLFGPRAVALLADEHPSGYGEPILQLVLRQKQLSVVEVSVSMRQRMAGKSTLAPIPASIAIARAFARIVAAPACQPVPIDARRGP